MAGKYIVPGKYIPKRGDIVFTNVDPAVGQEQAMPRPALVLSAEAFNRKIKLAMVAPVTSHVRRHGFEVELTGTDTHGVVLCQQAKIINYHARGIRFIESAPLDVVNDVLAKVKAILS